MIRTGIAGGASEDAGELIRILVNHPDVELRFIQGRGMDGRDVSDVHHGLVGELSMKMTDHVTVDDIDLLFVADPEFYESELYRDGLPEELRVIDMTDSGSVSPDSVAGVSEIYRKQLVRGARRAHLVHPLVSGTLVALYPLATHLLLKDVRCVVALPSSMISDQAVQRAMRSAEEALAAVQRSFDEKIMVEQIAGVAGRDMRLQFTFPCTLSSDDVANLYEGIYDDHNFTFLTSTQRPGEEVAGTNRCLIHISKPDRQTLSIELIADARMRGGAGEAVHVMNLLFGLHEKTGLALKASAYSVSQGV